VGCRTVTLREGGARLILRVHRGKGVAYLGSTKVILAYAYVIIPPDTAYYFENTGDRPLEIDYITLK
jgi:hypothetical protein